MNWKEINENVAKILSFLQKKYPNQVKSYLDWFDIYDNKSINLNDKKVQNWIIIGIPKVKIIILLINNEIISIEKIIDSILISNNSLDIKQKKLNPYYQGLKDLINLKIDFLGCKNTIGSWFLGMLNYLSYLPLISQNIGFFQDQCLISRQNILRLK